MRSRVAFRTGFATTLEGPASIVILAAVTNKAAFAKLKVMPDITSAMGHHGPFGGGHHLWLKSF
jgi:hypothetical protein